MEVGDSWVTGQEAVHAFQGVCIPRKWLFVPVPDEVDFGKDGYVDATKDGLLTGDAFAVQIKGGESYRAKDGYRISVGGHSDYWRNSALPIIGMVQDPVDKRLRWVNLTQTLRDEPGVKSVFVRGDAYVDDDAQLELLVESVRATLNDREPQIPIGLGSPATRDQIDAVWQCFVLAARQPEALVAVRRAFLALHPSARVAGVDALSLCTPHPDVFWTSNNQLPPPARNVVCASMRWAPHEVGELLRLVDDEDGFGRGSLGQSIYMILAEDPDLDRALWPIAMGDLDLTVAAWAAFIFVFRADDQPATWQALLDERPDLRLTAIGDYITMCLEESGWVSIFGG